MVKGQIRGQANKFPMVLLCGHPIWSSEEEPLTFKANTKRTKKEDDDDGNTEEILDDDEPTGETSENSSEPKTIKTGKSLTLFRAIAIYDD